MKLGKEAILRLNEILEPDNRANRFALRKLFCSDPIFAPKYNLALKEERELALNRLKRFCLPNGQYISVHDFERNPLNIYAVHEIAGWVDGSMATKMTVQFNLFGGTLLALGSERHKSIIDGVDSLRTIGCFALTELGYGNNAVEMETTATFDPKSKFLIINTPRGLAQKYWITNSAIHAHYAIVFAQLLIPKGEKMLGEGVHAILVPIRDQRSGQVMKGVRIEDMGPKLECNGVDNGKLWFNQVKVPVLNLLNKYSDITPKGEFISQIKSKRARFLKVANRLLSGRLCIASMMIACTKMALLISIRYSKSRLAVGPSGKSDTAIIKYELQRKAIYPLVASSIILNIGLNFVKRKFLENSTDLVRLCCVIKPLISWNAERVASICRERSGGQGYMAINVFGSCIGFSHSGITAEGDNAVLMQKVTKELLEDPPLAKEAAPEWESNLSLEYLANLIKFRASKALQIVQEKFDGEFETWMGRLSDEIQMAARAYGQSICINAASEFSEEIVKETCRLYALSLLRDDLAWMILNKILSVEQSKVILEAFSSTVRKFEESAEAWIEAFMIPEGMIYAPIARDWVKYNDVDNFGQVIDRSKY